MIGMWSSCRMLSDFGSWLFDRIFNHLFFFGLFSFGWAKQLADLARLAFLLRRLWAPTVMFFWPTKWTMNLWTWSMGLRFESSQGPHKKSCQWCGRRWWSDRDFWCLICLICLMTCQIADCSDMFISNWYLSCESECILLPRFQVWSVWEMWNGLARSRLPDTRRCTGGSPALVVIWSFSHWIGFKGKS